MANPLPEPISTGIGDISVNVEVVRSTFLLLLVALSHVGVIIVVMLAVFFCGGCCPSCGICHSCGLGIFRLSGCISINNSLILISDHSCNWTVMVWTGRVKYDGRVAIVVGIDIGMILRRFYDIIPASVAIITIIVVIFIIFSRYEVLVSLFIVWFDAGYFMLQYIKDLQSDGGSTRKPPDQLANASGEQ